MAPPAVGRQPTGRRCAWPPSRSSAAVAAGWASGSRIRGRPELPRSLREAQLALRLQKASSAAERTSAFADLDVLRMLASVEDLADVEGYVRKWLGVLAAYDERKHTQLVKTLTQYLQHGGGYEATSQALSVHRSTLKYRLQRIRELTGFDLGDPETRFNLELATRAWVTLQALRELTEGSLPGGVGALRWPLQDEAHLRRSSYVLAMDAPARALRADVLPAPFRGACRHAVPAGPYPRPCAPGSRPGGDRGRVRRPCSARATARWAPTGATRTRWRAALRPTRCWPSCSAARAGSARARADPCTSPASSTATTAPTRSSGRTCRSPAGWPGRRRSAARGQVTVCFFGDGTTNIGAFHEAVNLAAVWRLPVVVRLREQLVHGVHPDRGRHPGRAARR